MVDIEECPAVKNVKAAIEAIDDAFLSSQVDALRQIGDKLKNASNPPPGQQLPPGPQQRAVLCVAAGSAFDDSNKLRASCTFDPTGCLKQVLDSGIFQDNPILRGAALAAATLVDAASTGRLPFTTNITPPTIGAGDFVSPIPTAPPVDLPELPSPPPSEECPNPITALNEAINSAEETYSELTRKATDSIADSIIDAVGFIPSLPRNAQVGALCVSANAAFDATGGLSFVCSIDVTGCLRQTLEAGIAGLPLAGVAALGATQGANLFANNFSTSGI